MDKQTFDKLIVLSRDKTPVFTPEEREERINARVALGGLGTEEYWKLFGGYPFKKYET